VFSKPNKVEAEGWRDSLYRVYKSGQQSMRVAVYGCKHDATLFEVSPSSACAFDQVWCCDLTSWLVCHSQSVRCSHYGVTGRKHIRLNMGYGDGPGAAAGILQVPCGNRPRRRCIHRHSLPQCAEGAPVELHDVRCCAASACGACSPWLDAGTAAHDCKLHGRSHQDSIQVRICHMSCLHLLALHRLWSCNAVVAPQKLSPLLRPARSASWCRRWSA